MRDWSSVVVVRIVPGFCDRAGVGARSGLRGGHQEHARFGSLARCVECRGVASSNAVQGIAAATGLGALIVRVQPLFEAIKWAGVVYLAYLGVQAVRSAIRGTYSSLEADAADGRVAGAALGGWRQGFLSNITNPKVLVFYLAVLPQFLTADTGTPVLLVFAVSHALLSLLYLLVLTTFLHRARRILTRRRVRRGLDAVTGTALVGFSVRLATQRV